MRIDGRMNNEIRNVRITRNYTKFAQGSVLMEMGETKVICTAIIEEKVPVFLKNTGSGWITAEYNMLPGSTQTRKQRDITRLKMDGRSTEIQRLIGRALRSVVDLTALGEKTIWIDCDVIQADGGTRTASITGAFVALVDAINHIDGLTPFKRYPLDSIVTAVSVGVHNGEPLLDLCYLEDSSAQVDMNIVMNSHGDFIELQGTGEERPFTNIELMDMLELGVAGNNALADKIREVLGNALQKVGRDTGKGQVKK